MVFIRLIVLFGYFLCSMAALSQSVIEQISGEDSDESIANLPLETIEKISASRRIYVITNTGGVVTKGDFISLLIDNNLVARSLVVKTADGLSGIKLMRVYSPDLLNTLYPGKKVQVIRGDDSYFKNKIAKDKNKKEEKVLIENEEDLFNETMLVEDNITLDDNKNRLIKQDNILAVALGKVHGHNQWSASWAYQLSYNIWAEAFYGHNIINDFPEVGLDTSLSNFIVRGKYTFAAPAYSYIKLYAGYQIIHAHSPGAGQQGSDSSIDNTQLRLELQKLESLKRSSPVVGVSLLKRLVPGWFARADLGTDIISFGVGLEF